MKKALKIAGYVLGSITLLLIIGGAYIEFSSLPKYEVILPDYPAFKPDSTMIAEGMRTVSMVCAQCHKADNGKLEGKYLPEIPEMFGKAWSGNITNHPTYGIGRYSNAELALLLRTGIQKDGDFIPFMPQYTHLSDYDIQCIIAYLRTESPELSPSDKAQPATQASFLGKLLCRTVFKPAPYPDKPVLPPPAGDAVALGRYLATAKLDCFGCHSPDFMDINAEDPEKTPGYMSGGNMLNDLEGNPIVSRNLTPDKETGLGNWTEEQFVKTLRTGIRENGPALRFPMMPLPALTEEEAKAIWAYLKTIPPIRNDVDLVKK